MDTGETTRAARSLRNAEMRSQFTKTEQDRGLEHLHIDSGSTVGIRKSAPDSVVRSALRTTRFGSPQSPVWGSLVTSLSEENSQGDSIGYD